MQQQYLRLIPRNIRLAEAPSHGLPINLYDPRSAGAESLKSPNVAIHYAEDIYCPFDLLEETEPTQEPTEETSQEPTQEPTEETSPDTTEETSHEPTQEPEQKVIKKHAGDVIKNPYMVNNKLQTYSRQDRGRKAARC